MPDNKLIVKELENLIWLEIGVDHWGQDDLKARLKANELRDLLNNKRFQTIHNSIQYKVLYTSHLAGHKISESTASLIEFFDLS